MGCDPQPMFIDDHFWLSIMSPMLSCARSEGKLGEGRFEAHASTFLYAAYVSTWFSFTCLDHHG